MVGRKSQCTQRIEQYIYKGGRALLVAAFTRTEKQKQKTQLIPRKASEQTRPSSLEQ